MRLRMHSTAHTSSAILHVSDQALLPTDADPGRREQEGHSRRTPTLVRCRRHVRRRLLGFSGAACGTQGGGRVREAGLQFPTHRMFCQDPRGTFLHFAAEKKCRNPSRTRKQKRIIGGGRLSTFGVFCGAPVMKTGVPLEVIAGFSVHLHAANERDL